MESESPEQYRKDSVETIALQAADMPEFQDLVRRAQSKIEAIKLVRAKLSEWFPEISDLPKPEPAPEPPPSPNPHSMFLRPDRIFPPVDKNDFFIAREIVEILFRKQG